MAQNLLRNHLVNCWICSSNSESTVDMYNPEMNTLDIRSNGLYPLECVEQSVQQWIPIRRNGVWQYGGLLAIVEEARP